MRTLFTVTAMLVMVGLLLAGCGRGMETPTATPAPTAAAEQPAPAVAEAPAAPAGDAEKGRQLFVASCSACHGPNGEGVQGLGKDMQHSEFIAGLTDDELVAFIKTGRPIGDPLNTTGVDMPPKGGNPAITDEQLMDIVAFMRSIHE